MKNRQRSHMWGIGYGAWSGGNITDDLIQEYLDHHKERSNEYTENFMLE
jgi:putative transposase|tara:strand:+ start:82 stop:228 length:147 start_codon:yes stop_codon:yes gene_type:complete